MRRGNRSPMAVDTFRPVIGLEVHAQLLTRSKMFCGCDARYSSAPPNSHVCAICGGMPGSLPVINKLAMEQALLTALALHCEVPELTKFDRKNYQYPDIPKGYQISQYDMPIGVNGWLEYRLEGATLRCGITRVHVEEDTGKSLHLPMDGQDVSLVDYNRSGVPLMEIVTEPDLRSPEEARELFAALRQTLMYLRVCDGRLEEGSMRADVNVSLRKENDRPGTKVEIKNLNSFRAVERALQYEIDRQAAALGSGIQVIQETRGWSESQDVTISQRTKEYAQDYRYFPEPDLPPVAVSREWVRLVSERIPELPADRRVRFESQYGLPSRLSAVLTGDRDLAQFYERAIADVPGIDAKALANWVTGDYLRLLNDSGASVAESPVDPGDLGRLVQLVSSGSVSGPAGKHVLETMFETGEAPDAIVEREDLVQIADDVALEELVDAVLAQNEAMTAAYRSGKTNVVQALVGQIMKATRGRANPRRVREILDRKLGPAGSP